MSTAVDLYVEQHGCAREDVVLRIRPGQTGFRWEAVLREG